MRSLLIFLLFIATFLTNAQQSNSPKLVVGIVVDQMCYDYLYRFYDRYGKKGFVKLMENGTNCRNTNYNYIPTYTGPGHASIYTGATPSDHGIVANDWYDRNTGNSINCVEDSTVRPIGTLSENGKFSPVNLKTNTITDQLKMTYSGAKVISVSIKNRGAILPGGHLSDGSYWYDFSSGHFITSSFYTDALPSWVASFNKKGFVDKYLAGTWNTLYEAASYTASGPDDSPYEHLLTGKTTPTFPYNLKEMSNTQGVSKYSLFTYTPFANTYLTDFALEAIKNEELGRDNVTDFLNISYSTPDIAGHAFGPYSVEIEDMYLRLDQDIAKLITYLEENFGKDGFTLFLTADHAVVPVPQYLIDRKMPGGYFFGDSLIGGLREQLKAKYKTDLVLSYDNLNIYLDHKKIDSLSLNLKQVSEEVAAIILEWDEVKKAYTAAQLSGKGMNDEWMDMVRKGYHKEESGDVLFILEAGYLPKSEDTELARKGTSHGSAHTYDTHVPLLWYGKNIPTNEVFREINITDISATLAHLLYLQKPSSSTGRAILEILQP